MNRQAIISLLGFVFFLVSAEAAGAQSMTHYHVAETGLDSNPGTAADPFSSIQMASSVADPGDTISVHNGTYDEFNIPIPGGVLLRGFSGDPEDVVVNAAGNGPGFIGSNLPSGTQLASLKIIEGAGAVLVDSSSISITDCFFRENDNHTGNGGAIQATNGDLYVEGCTFVYNFSGFNGGAIYASGSDADIEGCVFSENSAAGDGGAVMLNTAGSTSVLNSYFYLNGNVSGIGGAIRYSSYEAVEFKVKNCEFQENYTGSGAAAISVFTSPIEGQGFPFTVIQNSTFVANSGGSVVSNLQYEVRLETSTFANNYVEEVLSMDGSASNVEVLVSRVLIAFNQGVPAGGYYDDLSLCNVFGNSGGNYVGPLDGFEGDYNFAADPLFCDLLGGDVTLDAASPCLIANSPLMEPSDVGSMGQGCEVSPVIPELLTSNFELHAASPNPFNPTTSIGFSLPSQEVVSLKIFDLSGRLVRTLVDNEVVAAGTHRHLWNGLDALGRKSSSGVYLYHLKAGAYVSTKRMMLVK